MRHRSITLVALLLTGLALPPGAAAAAAGQATQPALPPPVRPQQVQRFIKDLVTAIYASRKPNKPHWDERETDPGGSDHIFAGNTALACYALLAAGESPQDPKLRAALDWLKRAKTRGTYVVAVRLCAYGYLPPATVRDLAKFDQAFLLRAQIPMVDPKTKVPTKGGGLYDYLDVPDYNRIDHSVSQYAVLGMWACEQLGLPAPEGYWRNIEQAFVRDQHEDGGWSYAGTGPAGISTGSMTAAGLASLFVAQDFLRGAQAVAAGKGNVTNEPIERGIAFLAKNFNAYENPNDKGNSFLYWLYSVERVGLASGLKTFGKHNWFEEGARAMAARYYRNGKFVFEAAGSDVDLHDLCFALLFLARGQKPFVINKLRYEGNWNERPRDAANLAKWYGQRIESELLWQVVELGAALERDLHDAPVTYMPGFGPLNLSAAHKAALKRYMEDGGLILANANGQDAAFVESFKQLMAELFPQYPMRPLPPGHPIHTASVRLSKPIPILGVSNGIRELALLLPETDPPRAWQSQPYKANPDLFDVAGNVIAYASERGRLRTRGETYFVTPDPARVPQRTVKLARVRHVGAWDPEPGGWRRMAAILRNENLVDLKVEEVTLGEGKLPQLGAKVAHLTGMHAFEWTDRQLGEVRAFLGRGGMLIIDAAGGSEAFARAAEQQVARLLPDVPLTDISPEDPALADTRPLPEPLADLFDERPGPATRPVGPPQPLVVELRRALRASTEGPPRLRLKGLRLGRRWAVVISPLDLSAGLVGHRVEGIQGYSPATATEVVRRLIVNAR